MIGKPNDPTPKPAPTLEGALTLARLNVILGAQAVVITSVKIPANDFFDRMHAVGFGDLCRSILHLAIAVKALDIANGLSDGTLTLDSIMSDVARLNTAIDNLTAGKPT